MSQRSKLDAETHGRLMNWARWASGGIPGCVTTHLADEGWAADELDAAQLEAGLVRMRAERKRDYRLLRWIYLHRWSIATICGALRCSQAGYYRRLHAAYGCLRNILARRAA